MADVPLNVVILGPPGAGKGTQAECFARDHRIPKVSTGDILREAVSAGTGLGRQVKALMDRGELVGDDLMIEIVDDRLKRADAASGFVLDGFPRTVEQARALDQLLAGRGPVVVVEIQVPDEELVRRVGSRRICSKCGRMVSAFAGEGAQVAKCSYCGGELMTRSDDSEGVVRDRLKVYRRQTQPMIAFYRERPTFRAVDGAQSPERVREALVAAVASGSGRRVEELKCGQAQPGSQA